MEDPSSEHDASWHLPASEWIWSRRWKIVILAAGFGLGQLCEYLPEGHAQNVCEAIHKLVVVP